MRRPAEMLKQRIVTAIILLIGLIAASTLMSPFSFSILAGVIVLLAGWEWGGFIGLENLTTKISYLISLILMMVGCFFLLELTPQAEALRLDRAITLSVMGLIYWMCAAFLVLNYPAQNKLWNNESKIATMGIFSLLPTWVGVTQLKYLEPDGILVLALIILVAAVDVGAYFTGMNLGKTKLAPELSPNKTWEGVWGGFGLCVVATLIFATALNYSLFSVGLIEIIALIFMSLLVTFFSVTGDLVESMLKRNRQIKDSGKILPGHGGVLDRVDGLLAATPVFVLVMTYLVLSGRSL